VARPAAALGCAIGGDAFDRGRRVGRAEDRRRAPGCERAPVV